MNASFFKSTILLAAVVLLATGCAKENKGNSSGTGECRGSCSNGPLPPTGTGTDPGATGYDSGSTAQLSLSGGTATLTKMFFNSNPNSPKNVRVNIDLRRKSDSVIVSYVDGGKVVEAAFGVVHPYSGHTNAQFNGWVNQDGKSIYKGFFQDQYGAIILIIDQVMSQGDGQPSEFVGGEIWFQNFNRYYPNYSQQGPLKMCWEIQMGPYDCRTFLTGSGDNKKVNVISSYYPNNKGPDANMYYEKLGTFSGLSFDAAGL